LSPKNGLLGQRPGPGKDGQNNAKTPLLLTSPPENFFFLILTPRLAESVEGLNSSLVLAAGDLWSKKEGANMLAHAVVKGLKTLQRMFIFSI